MTESEFIPNTFQMPNHVDDLGLSVYAFRLYCHLLRIADRNGVSRQSTTLLAKACNMSAGSVSNAKSELERAGLIRVFVVSNEIGQYFSHEISITGFQ